jgi:3'-5' exoribonuclease
MLQEGDVVNDYFLATRKDLREGSNGGKFLGMVFKDRTGEIGGILWNNAVSAARLFDVGDVVNVRGSITSYQDRLQVRVEQVLPLQESEYSREELIVMAEDGEESLVKLKEILASVKNEWIAKLVNSFLDDADFMKRFSEAAAGKRWHHAYRGGLVRHCYEVARIAICVCDLFPNADRDLMIAGAFLHDIGKLDEMSQEMLVDYTTAGKLLGHIEISADMIRARINAIPDFPDTLRMHILHCILAHHGELVNGSPVVPKTLESMLLYQCDNLDAQVDALSRVIRESKEKRQEWSEYIPLISRQIWTK